MVDSNCRQLLAFVVVTTMSSFCRADEPAAAPSASALPFAWQPIPLPSEASLRGIAVSASGTICVAGNGPQVWISNDRGSTWSKRTPNSSGVTDYRSVAMPIGEVLVVASAGTPAVILRSQDLGVTWQTAHDDERAAAFIDSVRFWDTQRGMAFGDPVEGAFWFRVTKDGGKTWSDRGCQIPPLAGEAGFAASNGSLAMMSPDSILVGLGGREDQGPSRVLHSEDAGRNWGVSEVADMPANASSGIFSVAMGEGGFGVAVGGDYKQTERRIGNIAVTDDQGRSWRLPKGQRPGGFRSSVIFVPAKGKARRPMGYWLATGPSGTDISDDGEDWRTLGGTGYHALCLLPDGTPLASGADGRVAILRMTE